MYLTVQASKTQLHVLQMHAIWGHTGDDKASLCSQNLVPLRGKVTLSTGLDKQKYSA